MKIKFACKISVNQWNESQNKIRSILSFPAWHSTPKAVFPETSSTKWITAIKPQSAVLFSTGCAHIEILNEEWHD